MAGVCTVTEGIRPDLHGERGRHPGLLGGGPGRIERDVFAGRAYLAACDPSINNKSVGNRAGAAMVGMCVGHPGLVHFGLDGFRQNSGRVVPPRWRHSESAAYAMMTMGGVATSRSCSRGYSDPLGYRGPDGVPSSTTSMPAATRAMATAGKGWSWTLQGNLLHPPSADSYRTTDQCLLRRAAGPGLSNARAYRPPSKGVER